MTSQTEPTLDDKVLSPEFLHALMEYKIYADAGLTEIPTALAAMGRVLEHAPAALKRQLAAKAEALGLLPAQSACLGDGTPVYEVNALAAHLGLREVEITKIPFSGELLCPTNSKRWIAPVGVRGVFSRYRKF